MEDIKVSLFASAVRPRIWKECLDSFLSNKIKFEVIFGGPCEEEIVKPFLQKYSFFRYIKTANIKPAQCYEVARRACNGEAISWIADDVEFSENSKSSAIQEIASPLQA